MSTTTTNPATAGHTDAGARTGALRRVSWGSILVGVVIAQALMVLFTTLGIGIGAGSYNPAAEQNPAEGIGIGGGIYFVITQLVALAAGGYAAAKLAGVPRMQAALLHGAAVWALSTLILTWAAITGGGAAFGAASNVFRSAGQAAQSVVPDDFSLPNPSRLASNLSINDLPPEVQSTLREAGLTDQQLGNEAQQAFRNVFSQQEQQRAMQRIQTAAVDAVRSPEDIQSDMQSLADDLVGGENAIISEEDRQEAYAVLQQRLGISQQEAQQIGQAVEQRVQQAVDLMRETIQTAVQRTVEAAQSAADAVSSSALALALASLLGLVACCGGAFAGKPESLVGDRADDHA